MHRIVLPSKNIPSAAALTSNVTVFRDRAFREAIKVKWCHTGGALIQLDWCSHKKTYQKCSCTDERQCEYTARRWSSARKRGSQETNFAGNLILDLQPPDLWGNEFLLFKQPNLCYSIFIICYTPKKRWMKYHCIKMCWKGNTFQQNIK